MQVHSVRIDDPHVSVIRRILPPTLRCGIDSRQLAAETG